MTQETTSEILNIISHAIDIVAVSDIQELIELESQNFERLCFTAIERSTSISSINRIHYFAGRFAAKKAILKVLNRDCQQSCLWLDIEIQRLSTGEPSVILHNKCQKIAVALGIKKWLVSISHTSSYATASAIALGSTSNLK